MLRRLSICAIYLITAPITAEGLAPLPTSLRHLRTIPSDAQSSSSAVHAQRRRSKRRRRRRRMRHGHGDYDDDDYDDGEDCELVERSDLSILGLAKSIDAEYKNEEDKLGLNFFEVLQRERERPIDQISKKSRDMTPLQRTRRRMNYAKGNIENKYVMMTTRQYGSADLLDKDHLNEPPTLDDLNQTPG
eukprot:scaffold2521_cov95-Skeletonema_marinoi.AAC.1